MSTDRCNYCGFPADTPSRAHDFIHQQGEALIEHRKEMRRLYDLSETLRAENAALREDARELAAALNSVLQGIPVRNADELIERQQQSSQGGGWRCEPCRSSGTGKPAVRDGKDVCPLCLGELHMESKS